jgi:hypothetical protein
MGRCELSMPTPADMLFFHKDTFRTLPEYADFKGRIYGLIYYGRSARTRPWDVLLCPNKKPVILGYMTRLEKTGKHTFRGVMLFGYKINAISCKKGVLQLTKAEIKMLLEGDLLNPPKGLTKHELRHEGALVRKGINSKNAKWTPYEGENKALDNYSNDHSLLDEDWAKMQEIRKSMGVSHYGKY